MPSGPSCNIISMRRLGCGVRGTNGQRDPDVDGLPRHLENCVWP